MALALLRQLVVFAAGAGFGVLVVMWWIYRRFWEMA